MSTKYALESFKLNSTQIVLLNAITHLKSKLKIIWLEGMPTTYSMRCVSWPPPLPSHRVSWNMSGILKYAVEHPNRQSFLNRLYWNLNLLSKLVYMYVWESMERYIACNLIYSTQKKNCMIKYTQNYLCNLLWPDNTGFLGCCTSESVFNISSETYISLCSVIFCAFFLWFIRYS